MKSFCHTLREDACDTRASHCHAVLRRRGSESSISAQAIYMCFRAGDMCALRPRKADLQLGPTIYCRHTCLESKKVADPPSSGPCESSGEGYSHKHKAVAPPQRCVCVVAGNPTWVTKCPSPFQSRRQQYDYGPFGRKTGKVLGWG